MEYFLRFVQPWFLCILGPLIILGILLKRYVSLQTSIRHALVNACKKNNLQSKHPYKKILFLFRLVILLLLSLVIAKPQLVDSRSQVEMQGIDIVLALDMSGSMGYQDYADDQRSRFDIAKQEAIRFIEKRVNDAIGLVIFGDLAVSRCPLTFDKNIIKKIVEELNLGLIDQRGTVLSRALVTAANRLKKSKAKSKVIILLTDGEPTEHDIPPDQALEVVQKFGIKVYTMGIGDDKDNMIYDPFFGLVPKPKLNTRLLKKIAEKTGGKFFLAHNAQDMRTIYDTIDTLEKSEKSAPVFSKYHDLGVPAAAILMALLLVEVFLSSIIWFGI